MIEGNPLGFVDENYGDTELSYGTAGQELLDPQWALAEVTAADYRRSKTANTPDIFFTLKLDDTLALQPKRVKSFDLYLTPGMQPFIDGLFAATGLGKPSHKFGVRHKKLEGGGTEEVNDPREIAPDIDAYGKMLASALKGKKFIVAIGVEVDKDGVYDDKNKLTGFHKITEDNLAALKESGFGPKSISVKKKQDGTPYLVAKKGGGNKATPNAGAAKVMA